MKKKLSIQLKAAFLLIVFGMNMAVGFACATGLDDIVLHAAHAGHDEGTEVHLHVHEVKHHHDKEHTSKKDADGCCNDKVVKLAQVDKAVPQADNLVHPSFLIAFIAHYYSGDTRYHSQVNTTKWYFVRSYHPPIPDIGIAIQRFQI